MVLEMIYCSCESTQYSNYIAEILDHSPCIYQKLFFLDHLTQKKNLLLIFKSLKFYQ